MGGSTTTRVVTKAPNVITPMVPTNQTTHDRARPRLPVGSKKIGFMGMAGVVDKTPSGVIQPPLLPRACEQMGATSGPQAAAEQRRTGLAREVLSDPDQDHEGEGGQQHDRHDRDNQ
jgi:hypothetical protein